MILVIRHIELAFEGLLQKISNKYFSFELSIHQIIVNKNYSTKNINLQLFSTLIIIIKEVY